MVLFPGLPKCLCLSVCMHAVPIAGLAAKRPNSSSNEALSKLSSRQKANRAQLAALSALTNGLAILPAPQEGAHFVGAGQYRLLFRAPLPVEAAPDTLLALVRDPSTIALVMECHARDSYLPLEAHVDMLSTAVEDCIMGPIYGPQVCALAAQHCTNYMAAYAAVPARDQRYGSMLLERLYPTANYPNAEAGGIVDVVRLWRGRFGPIKNLYLLQVGWCRGRASTGCNSAIKACPVLFLGPNLPAGLASLAVHSPTACFPACACQSLNMGRADDCCVPPSALLFFVVPSCRLRVMRVCSWP